MIAESAPANKRVFGTTLTLDPRFPRSDSPDKFGSPRKLFFSQTQTDELGLVGKVSVRDAWESPDPRFFITPSHAEAAHNLAISYAELPARESVLA